MKKAASKALLSILAVAASLGNKSGVADIDASAGKRKVISPILKPYYDILASNDKIKAEYELIQKKQSKLSRSQRDNIVRLYKWKFERDVDA